MGTIKKFFIYFLLFIALFAFVEIFRELALKKAEKEKYMIDYTVNVNSPKIIVASSKASDTEVNIKGCIINETGEHIRNKVLQFDFYDNNDTYLGTEVKQINYFNVNEKIKFDISRDYKNVDRIDILYLDEALEHKTEEQAEETLRIFNTNDKAVKIALPIATVLTMLMIIP